MSERVSNCPGCGAPIKFLWSSAIQTTCEFCKSILVRTDVDLEKVGQVADLPPDASPIQIGTEGVHRNRPFTVIGRIVYEYQQGYWNEWHLIFNDGTSGWLSDAQLDYAVSYLWQPPSPLPPASNCNRQASFQWNGATYQVTVITTAHYVGVQGELPFKYWDKSDCLFVDLRTTDARFATIDYTETPPILFVGEAIDFADLHLKNLRQFDGWTQ